VNVSLLILVVMDGVCGRTKEEQWRQVKYDFSKAFRRASYPPPLSKLTAS